MKNNQRLSGLLLEPFHISLKLRIGLVLILFMAIFFSTTALVYGFNPYSTDLPHKNCVPDCSHLFGTDELGRDLLSRVTQGLFISCSIGLAAFIIDMTVGLFWGAITALTSPSLISVGMKKMAEILYSLPYLLVVILVSVFTGTGLIPLVVAMLLMGWVQTARMVEMLTKEAVNSEYVISARVMGVSTPRIVIRHILPNIISPIIASSLMSIPHAIFAEAFLSFLGVGIQPPMSSLGSLISDALPAIRFYPWRILFPSSVITTLILSLTVISDVIMEVADPRLSRNLMR